MEGFIIDERCYNGDMNGMDTVVGVTATAIVNSDIPATAKKALLRLNNDHNLQSRMNEDGDFAVLNVKENHPPNVIDFDSDANAIHTNYHATPMTNLTGTTENMTMRNSTADMEQSRSVSLIQKLRQSAFRRKMMHTSDDMMDHQPHHPHDNTSSASSSSYITTNTKIIPIPNSTIHNTSDDETPNRPSPTSVRDRTTLSPLPPTSILKHRTSSTFGSIQSSDISRTSLLLRNSSSPIRNHYQNRHPIDLSPQTLVVGRLEGHGMLNLRRPLIRNEQITNDKKDDDNDSTTSDHSNSLIPHHPTEYVYDHPHRQSPDSLMISDSSLEGDFDSQSELMAVSSMISGSDTATHHHTTSLGDTTKQIISTNIVVGVSSSTGVNIHTNNSINSVEFMQQLRGAAFRRKMNLTRSRDSLMNKEKEHRAHNAAVKLQQEMMERNRQESISLHQQQQKEEQEQKGKLIQPFKALPLPKTSRLHNHGGLVGVPKIDKRPPTIPISPHLGLQRRRRQLVGMNDKEGDIYEDMRTSNNDDVNEDARPRTDQSKTSKVPTSNAFKALPIPRSSLPVGGAGQAGIPKVPKRTVTIPQSPLLGMRRLSQQPRLVSSRPVPTVDSKLNVVRPDTTNGTFARATTTPSLHHIMASAIQPYVPYSTRRAIQRAEFEQRRIQNEQRRIEQERRAQQQLVQRLQGELERLRIEI